MKVKWYGQSAFQFTSPEASVFIDPFGDLSAMTSRGIQFDYPAIEGVSADLLLVTHEHLDHNGVEVIGGDPITLRSTAGKLESPIGEVHAIASEHDSAAGTERGPNTIFVFVLDGLRICHFGDFGQSELRPEQLQAIGEVDLLILPVGGGPTIDAEQAKAILAAIGPRWVLPMHYRTEKLGFLEPIDAFLDACEQTLRLEEASFDTAELPQAEHPVLVVPATP
jgi:L-ascorbate metabolism protein UlaG (beta-lactamase superfamily)